MELGTENTNFKCILSLCGPQTSSPLGQSPVSCTIYERRTGILSCRLFQTLQKSLTEPHHLLKADIKAIVNPIVRIIDLLSNEPSRGAPQHNLAQVIVDVFLPPLLHKSVPHVDEMLQVLLVHSKYPIEVLKVRSRHSARNMLILCNAICKKCFHRSRIG